MVKPVIVTTNADAGMTAPAVVMTTEVAVVALHVPVSPATLLLPAVIVGVMDGAKKLEGKLSVIVPPEGMEFAGVKPSVMGTDDLPAMRWYASILKKTSNTLGNESAIAGNTRAALSSDAVAI